MRATLFVFFLMLLASAFSLKGQYLVEDIRLRGYDYEIKNFNTQEIRFSVPNWRSLNLNQYDPDQVDVWVDFITPSGDTIRRNGFYFEQYHFSDSPSQPCDYAYLQPSGGAKKVANSRYEAYPLRKTYSEWRVRFRPDETGKWNFRIHARLKDFQNDQVYTYRYPGEKNLKEGLNFLVKPSKEKFEGYIGTKTHSKNRHSPAFLYHKKSGDPIILNGENLPDDRSNWLKQHVLTRPNQKNPNVPLPCKVFRNQRGLDISKRARGIGGICQYKGWINELSNHGGNYFRFAINGSANPDHSNHFMFYNPEKSSYSKQSAGALDFNLKNAWRYDKIIRYASAKDVYIKFNFLQFSIFTNKWHKWNPWSDKVRPGFYQNPCQFFNPNSRGFEELKAMLRYAIARWGHANNIVGWELIDEFGHITKNPQGGDSVTCFEAADSLKSWYHSVAQYIKKLDRSRHPVSPGAFLAPGFFSEERKDTTVMEISQLNSLDYVEVNKAALGDVGNKCNCDIIRDFGSKTCIKTDDYCGNLKKVLPQNAESVNFSSAVFRKDRWETKNFYKYPLKMRKSIGKGVIFNSFWFNIRDHAFSTSTIDNPGVFYHNVLWRGLFSGSMSTTSIYYQKHPAYNRKNMTWNGQDKFDYMGHRQFDLRWNSPKVKFIDGQLEHFKGIGKFIPKIHYQKQTLLAYSNTLEDKNALVAFPFELENKNSHHIFGFKVPDPEMGLPKHYGYIQDTAFYFASLFRTNVDYLSGEANGDKDLPETKGITLDLKSPESRTYRLRFYDPLSGEKIEEQLICRSVLGALSFKTPPFNSHYGDLAFILTPNPLPTLKVNQKQKPEKLDASKNLTLAGSKLNTCQTETYKVIIRKVTDKALLEDGPLFEGEFDEANNPLANFDIQEACKNEGVALKPGKQYRLKLVTGDPERSNQITFRLTE